MNDERRTMNEEPDIGIWLFWICLGFRVSDFGLRLGVRDVLTCRAGLVF